MPTLSTLAGAMLSMWIAYASVPVGCTLMTFRMIQNGIKDVKAVKNGTFGGADIDTADIEEEGDR